MTRQAYPADQNWFIGYVVDAAWIAQLSLGAPQHARRFDERDLHMTIAFLGPVGRPAANAAWARALRALPPKDDVRLDAVEPFGNPRKPSAYALTLRTPGRSRVAAELSRLEGPLRSAVGMPTGGRSPRPHITIARPPRRATAAQRAELARWAAELRPPRHTLELREIGLYTWAKDRSRRLFDVVERAALTPSSPELQAS